MHFDSAHPRWGPEITEIVAALQPFAFACFAAIILPMGVDMSISAASPFDSLVTPLVSRSSGFIALNFLVKVSRSFGSDLRIVPARLVSALAGTIEAPNQTRVQMNCHGCEIYHNGLALAGMSLRITLASQFMLLVRSGRQQSSVHTPATHRRFQ